MSFLRHKVNPDELPPSDMAIRLHDGEGEAPKQTRWGMILVVFMRLMAGLWLAQGLVEWSSVLLPRSEVFDSVSGTAAAVIIFFAIADLVAAVGLWLATPWGGALWLFAATSQIFAAMTVKDAFSPGWIVIDVLLILIYFALTFKAGLDRE
jgi:Family of unknown function (DUF6163)